VSAMTALKNRVHAFLAQQREKKLLEALLKTYRHLETRIGESKAFVSRFTDAAHLHAYAGVIPSIHSSGDRTHYGKIIKAGNRWLRWAAVEAVWPAIRADFDLRCF